LTYINFCETFVVIEKLLKLEPLPISKLAYLGAKLLGFEVTIA